MDVAKSDSNSEPPIRPYNGNRSTILTGRILDLTHTLNFKDRYLLGEQLGWGQFGIIRECSDKLTGELLACKSISKDRLVTSDDVRSVKLEIEIMTRLSGHPNVVNLKAVYEDEDYVHLVMELCAGGELFHQLEKHGRFSESEALVLFRHLMKVVMYCHEKGIVHRDLKPENILLATKSCSSPIKLADFGLATYIKPGQNLHGTVGSPFYIAPEVLTGGYNQAADVWSAGVILYILLSGMPPFWGKTKSKIFDAVRAADLHFPPDPWDHISQSAKNLINGMLCMNPSTRLTAEQVLDHSWMKDGDRATQEMHNHSCRSCEQEPRDASWCSPFTARSQDFSFNDGSPVTVDNKAGVSPTFTCRSSFSSFLVDMSTPFSETVRFSFGSCESNAPEVSSPISSMPSFTFFSPSSTLRQGNDSLGRKAQLSTASAIQTDSSLGKQLFVFPTSPSTENPSSVEETEQKTETRQGGGTSGSKGVGGIRSRRNRTIGLGELDQLDDVIAVESVIRWASCTHIPTNPSLRSSLVC